MGSLLREILKSKYSPRCQKDTSLILFFLSFPAIPRETMGIKAQPFDIVTVRSFARFWIVAGLLFSACSNNSTSSSNFTAQELQQLRRNFQISETIISELNLIHEKTQTRPRPIKTEITPRLPRHVWHKAKLIHMSIQNLKSANGLEPKSQDYLDTRRVAPTDVQNLLQRILSDVRALRPVFGVVKNAKLAFVPDLVLPQDVYLNLERINQMILGIDNRATAPSDVYLTAYHIVVRLLQIRSHHRIDAPIAALPASSGKHPRDVYKQALTLHGKLKELAEKEEYSIFGGIQLLDRKNSRIIPNDVIDVLTTIQADVEAMSIPLGLLREKALPVLPQITPSNVYDMVSEAIAVVDTLL